MAHQEEERVYLRISWGAIIAGGVTALAVSALLNLLGIGLGFTAIDPATESAPLSGLGIGTIIWWVVANLTALFVGGMVAGHSAGYISRTDGGLHGFLSWCVYAAVLLFFLTTATGAVISGFSGAVSSVFGGGDQQEVVVRVDDQRQQAQDQEGLSFENVREKFIQLVDRAEQFNILPSDAAENVQETLNEGTADLRETWQELNLDQNIEEFFNDLSVDIENGNLNITVDGDVLNREKIKDYLAENTDLSEQEIEQNINEWNKNMEQAISEVEKLYQETREEIEQRTDQLADTIATVSLVAFFIFVLGAVAAWGGGMVAAAKLNPVVIKRDYK